MVVGLHYCSVMRCSRVCIGSRLPGCCGETGCVEGLGVECLGVVVLLFVGWIRMSWCCGGVGV